MNALDDAEFARVLAEARAVRVLNAAGLGPEVVERREGVAGCASSTNGGARRPAGTSATQPHPATPASIPAPDTAPTVKSPNESSADYRITGNGNPVKPPCTVKDLYRPLPPSTLVEIEQALARYESSRPRTIQKTLGPSELGTPCRRQIALKLAGVPRKPSTSLPWAPLCGTAVHSLMESVLEAENERLGRPRWVIEETVHLDDELKGHGDAYDADNACVIDWKYTGTTARRKASRKNVPNTDLVSPDYRVQAHLYGLGHENAGRPVRYVRLVMLARSHDFRESVEWTEEYRPDIAVDAMTRFYATRDEVTNLDAGRHPERLAAIEATPGDACHWCPFQRLGPDVDATGCAGTTAKAADPTAFFK